MFFKSVVLAASALMLSGCLVTSLNPLYTDKEIATDPGLLGNWTSTSDKDSLLVMQQDAKSYRLIMMEDGKVPGAYDLRLVQIGRYRFYDIFPTGPASAPGLVQEHYFPVHSFGRMERSGDTLRVSALSQDWMKQQLQSNPKLLAYRTSGDAVLLTSPTAELQKFLLAHMEESGVFGDWASYQRHR